MRFYLAPFAMTISLVALSGCTTVSGNPEFGISTSIAGPGCPILIDAGTPVLQYREGGEKIAYSNGKECPKTLAAAGDARIIRLKSITYDSTNAKLTTWKGSSDSAREITVRRKDTRSKKIGRHSFFSRKVAG